MSLRDSALRLTLLGLQEVSLSYMLKVANADMMLSSFCCAYWVFGGQFGYK
jgi:hypothetical protein